MKQQSIGGTPLRVKSVDTIKDSDCDEDKQKHQVSTDEEATPRLPSFEEPIMPMGALVHDSHVPSAGREEIQARVNQGKTLERKYV